MITVLLVMLLSFIGVCASMLVVYLITELMYNIGIVPTGYCLGNSELFLFSSR